MPAACTQPEITMPTPEATKTALENAFLEAPLTIAGKQLRPLSANSLLILQRTKNKLLTNAAKTPVDEAFDIADQDTFFALMAFLYIHSAPVAEVRRVVRASEIDFQDAVEDFAESISIADLLTAGEHASSEIATATAAMVEAEPPATDGPVTGLADPN
jgi:hypothetical protein